MKTPLTIQVGPDGTLTLTVELGRQERVRRAAKTVMSKEATDLELKLMSLDETDENKMLELNMEVLAYSDKLLKSGKRKELVQFLRKNKDRFNADLKSWLAETLRGKLSES